MIHKLELDDKDLQVINLGLQEVILRLAAPVIEKINKQILAERGVEQPPAPDEQA